MIKWRFILLYLIGWLLVAFGLFQFLRIRQYKLYSNFKLNEMEDSVSKWRDVTSDPCKYEIKGEPVTKGDDYIKLYFFCKDSKTSMNTLVYSIFADKKNSEVVREYARIIGFDPEIILNKNSKWSCGVDMEKIIKPKNVIECHEK